MIPASLLAASTALLLVQAVPPPAPLDPRIQLVPYEADQVVPLRAELGYAVLIELSPDERIENVVLGNSAVWQVTPNRQGDRLVVKPLAGAVPTNMVIATDRRRYVFLLEPSGGQSLSPFVMRFSYPAPVPAIATSTTPMATYKLDGAKELRPFAISDDGRRTTITWDRQTSLPAIFAVDARGREAIVNGRMVDGSYVVEGVAPRYVFRLGKARASATRSAPRSL